MRGTVAHVTLVIAAAFAAGCRTTAGASQIAGSGSCADVASAAAVRHVEVETQGMSGTPIVQAVSVGAESACVDLKDEESSYHVDVPLARDAASGACRVSGTLADSDAACAPATTGR